MGWQTKVKKRYPNLRAGAVLQDEPQDAMMPKKRSKKRAAPKRKRSSGSQPKRQVTTFSSKKIVELRGTPTEHARSAATYVEQFATAKMEFVNSIGGRHGGTCESALRHLIDAAEMKRGIGINAAMSGRAENRLQNKLATAQHDLRGMLSSYLSRCVR